MQDITLKNIFLLPSFSSSIFLFLLFKTQPKNKSPSIKAMLVSDGLIMVRQRMRETKLLTTRWRYTLWKFTGHLIPIILYWQPHPGLTTVHINKANCGYHASNNCLKRQSEYLL